MGAVIASKVPESYSRNPKRLELGEEHFMSGANVTVAGLMTNDGMGGLKESVAKFRAHHKEVGDALLNISGIDTLTGEPTDKDEPRPAYQRQEFPKMVYHAEKGELIVEDVDDVGGKMGLRSALKAGYRREPYPKPIVVVNDPATEKKALMDHNQQLQGQITSQNDVIERQNKLMESMAVRLSALEEGAGKSTDPDPDDGKAKKK